MKLFISYPSAQRDLAARLVLALEAEGHDVFHDRSDLNAGEAFHQRLREAVAAADAFVFLITPEAVAPGSYTLAELEFAQAHWRRPSGHVLPVMVVPTPISALPPYLSAVTVLQPRGELVAETVAAVARLKPGGAGKRMKIALGLALALAVAGGLGYVGMQRHAVEQARLEQQAAQQATQQRDAAQAASALKLCEDGSQAAALAQLNTLAAKQSALPAVQVAREDCAMLWLRNMRAVEGQQTFADQVAQTEPVLMQALPAASGARAADLRAHVGWGDYLRGRGGLVGLEPQRHWQRALNDDATNPYAHGMWARQLLDRSSNLPQARERFAQAVAGARQRPATLAFVRALQLGGSIGGGVELTAYALTVADDMRRHSEPLTERDKQRLWTYAFATRMLRADDRSVLLAALAPAQFLATFDALYPRGALDANQQLLWQFNRGTLLAQAGDREGARQAFEAVIGAMRSTRSSGSLLDESQRALARLQAPGSVESSRR
jgi:TIR domain